MMHSTASIQEINRSIEATRRHRRSTRFPGIDQDSHVLGISRIHLWCVLTGQRPNASIIHRYTQLLTTQRRPVPAHLGKAA